MNLLNISHAESTELSSSVGGYVHARYSFPANDEAQAQKMAVQIASGQTVGFVPDPIDSYLKYMGRILEVRVIDSGRGLAEIAFPGMLFGNDMSGVLTVLFGKISFAPGIRLENISVDNDNVYLSRIRSAKFGLSGIRHLCGVSADSPLLMAILKPGVGPDNNVLARQYVELVGAGTHLVKDDEVRVDESLDDAKRRLEAVLKASTKANVSGLYVQSLNSPAFEVRKRAIELIRAGAKAFLVCPFTYGLSVIQALSLDPEISVPIFAHPAFVGVLMGGVSPHVLLGSLMRLSSVDAVLFPSPYGSIALPKADAISIHQELIRPLGSMKVVASVPSAGIMPEFVKSISEDFGRDVVVNAGTGMARSGATISDGARAFLSEIKRCYS